jgi:hypothetical protein
MDAPALRSSTAPFVTVRLHGSSVLVVSGPEDAPTIDADVTLRFAELVAAGMRLAPVAPVAATAAEGAVAPDGRITVARLEVLEGTAVPEVDVDLAAGPERLDLHSAVVLAGRALSEILDPAPPTRAMELPPGH